MSVNLKKLITISLILMLTVGVVCFCCSCAVVNSATATPTTQAVIDNGILHDPYFEGEDEVESALSTVSQNAGIGEHTYLVCKGYSNYLDSTYSDTIVTRSEWICGLLDTLEVAIVDENDFSVKSYIDSKYYDNSEYFVTAAKNGYIGGVSKGFGQYAPATRQYVSTTLVMAAGYPRNYKLSCSDFAMIEDKKQAATCVELGFIELNENNCFDPYGYITQDQVDYILGELEYLKVLKGKTVLSFGDSIMHGDGNFNEGIADLLEKKYMMKAVDYSKGGSTFGYVRDREQISNQVIAAIKNKEKADVILLDGGTNDMRKVAPGEVSDDFEYKNHGRADFCSGMEYTLGLIDDKFADVPVLYVRAHNMKFSLERNEVHFGELALDICEKWQVNVADVFSDTNFNAHDELIKSEYTVHTKNCEKGDSVHPNKLGYEEFYIPLIAQKLNEIFA